MSKTFWRSLAERVAATFAQALLGAGFVGFAGAVSLGWQQQLLIALSAAALAVVKGIAATNVGSSNSPSLDPGATS